MIKDEFKKVTVITIAHRLNTIINYDRIMVLKNGNIAEFDTPERLLKDSNSELYRLVM